MLTRGALAALMPSADVAAWHDNLLSAMTTYAVNTPLRQAAFLAQVAVESQELTRLSENLMYTHVERLLEVFPSHFSGEADAAKYVGRPQAIANRVYAGRMGNGDELSGDGWRYRGRGLFQLTGKNEYRAYGLAQRAMDFLANPDRVAEPRWAADSAGWYWESNSLNVLADARDFKGITKHINGGYEAWAQRKAYYEKALGLLVE